MSNAVSHEHEVADLPSAVHFTPRGNGRHEFMASLLPGVFERKVLNLVLDQKADLKEFSDDHIQLRFGHKSLLPRKYAVDEVPVEVALRLHLDTPCPDSMVHVTVDICPRVHVQQEVFEQRCKRLVKAIHACFLGHHLRSN